MVIGQLDPSFWMCRKGFMLRCCGEVFPTGTRAPVRLCFGLFYWPVLCMGYILSSENSRVGP